MQVFDYYNSGSESESTVKFNRQAYQKMRLLPRMLVDVSNTDTSVTLLGKHLLPLHKNITLFTSTVVLLFCSQLQK